MRPLSEWRAGFDVPVLGRRVRSLFDAKPVTLVNPMLPGRKRVAFVLLLFASVGTLLLWLTWDLRPYPISANVDDYRYVVSADHIKDAPWKLWKVATGRSPSLEWLGPYDPTTLFKRPGLSIILAVFTLLHLPFLQTTLLLHLAALALLSNALLRLNYPRTVVAGVFLVCGLIPTLYDSNAVRVLREIPTGSLEVAIFGMCVWVFTIEADRTADLLKSRAFLVLLLLLALHWTMREETVLFLVPVLLLVNAALWLRVRTTFRKKLTLAAVVSVLLLSPSWLAYASIASLNKVSYGLFLVNDVSEGSFPKAISELRRVDETPCDHGFMSAEEVDKVMDVSPAFRVVGESLATALSVRPDMTYTDAFPNLRLGALGESDIGRSPQLTQDLFSRIAAEVRSACREGLLHCAPWASGSIVPLLCSSHWTQVPGNFKGYLIDRIARMWNNGFSPLSSAEPDMPRLHPDVLANFEATTRQKMSGRNGDRIEFSQPASLEVLVRQDFRRAAVGRIYLRFMPWLMLAGALSLLARLPFWRDTRRPWWLVILVGAGGYMVLRAMVFGYLSTIDGSLNNRYISVGYPVAGIFAVLAAAEARYLLPFGDKSRTSRRAGREISVVPLTVIAGLVTLAFIYAGARDGKEPDYEAPIAPVEGRLVEQGEARFIELDGRRLSILPEMQGGLYGEAGWLMGETAVFDGWAVDAAADRPAEAVLVFIEGELVATTSLTEEVPSLASELPAGARAGFTVDLPWRAVNGHRVRLFALLEGDHAGPLNYPAFYPYLE